LKKGKESVHMCDLPKVDKKLIDKKLEESMAMVRQIVESTLAARNQANLKLRWPVKEVLVVSKDKKISSAMKQLKEVLLSACNTKEIKHVKKKPKGQFSSVKFALGEVSVNKVLDEELLQEAMIKEVVRTIQDSRKRNGFNVRELIDLSLNSDDKTNRTINNYKNFLMKEVGARKLSIGKLEGKYKGKLEFEGKIIEIAFDK
jgi:isoleucyl-tRNA synthetase